MGVNAPLAPTAHHDIGPSSWDRVSTCPGSRALSKGMPDISHPAAREGTAAHELAAWCLAEERMADERLGQKITVEFEDPADPTLVAREDIEIDREMVYEVNRYCDYVRNLGGHQFYEQRVSIDPWVPGGFGTSDAIALAELPKHPGKAMLHVVDLKYGKSPLGKVSVGTVEEPNGQLAQYALGALDMIAKRGLGLQVVGVTLHVVQPRLDHFDSLSMSIADLMRFGPKVQAAVTACDDPDAPRVPSDKACIWCRGKVVCPEYADLVKRTVFEDLTVPRTRDVDSLLPPGIADDLKLVNMIRRWCDHLEGHALTLLQRGYEIDGYKLVRKRSNRQWVDDPKLLNKVISRVRKYGWGKKDVLSEPKLLSPAQLEKMVKQVANNEEFEAKFRTLVTKPEGGLALATADDPREAIVIEKFEDMTAGDAEGGAASYTLSIGETVVGTATDLHVTPDDPLALTEDDPLALPADFDPLAIDDDDPLAL